ncbi:MAG: DUF5685 family protein [Pyrinomonadaceae bacterium]
MRAKKCGMTDEEKHFRRLQYCGTCKTIGSLYGQKSRFLLNHDTVFLAEILTALSGENVQNRQKSYQSFNCLNLPEDKMPLSLQFAATANVVLTEFKLADHISDEGKSRYKFAYRTFSKEFEKAGKLLESWQFPLGEVKAILRTQNARESKISSENAIEILENLAEPTARTTAIFFAGGVRLVGKSELEASAYKIGFAFGKLIYLVDAFEDFEKDFRALRFNALRAAFDLKESKVPADAKRKVVSIVQDAENEIICEIKKLPLEESQKSLFISRLKTNLQRKLKTNLPVVSTKKTCAIKSKRTFSERWENAKETARSMARGFSWQMPLVFLFVFAFALVAPAQSREAKSARECFDLSFNLMFLSAVFGSVLAFPKTIWMQNPVGKRRKAQQSAGEDTSEGCCDTWDCCCCACDGCDGCCEGCDCCSGCCDGCDCCSCDC